MGDKKNYMLDTSVLLHDPKAFCNFADNNVLIPAAFVLRQLNELKTQPGDRGANARDALRALLDTFCLDSGGIEYQSERVSDAGKTQPCMHTLLKAWNVPGDDGGRVALVSCTADEDILDIAKEYHAILVTKDVPTRLLAVSRQLEAQDYLHDHTLIEQGRTYTGRSILYLDETSMAEIAKGQCEVSLPTSFHIPICYMDDTTGQEQMRPENYHLTANEFIIVKNVSDPASGSVLARYTANGKLAGLNYDKSNPYAVKPRNIAQHFAIESLMQSPTAAPLVILQGPAGTAKTFLSLACALQQAFNDEIYQSILVTRPATLLDEGIGFLPGDELSKTGPLLRSCIDNIETLMPDAKRTFKEGIPFGPFEELVARGVLQVQSMSFMRGRSIANQFVIIDEAQNATPHQLLTLVTRVSSGTKIVVIGDPHQIDNPYLDKYSNGLTYLSEMMRGSPLCWQLAFTENECERSALATDTIRRMALRTSL